jgi:hypothetical protein
MTEVKTISLAKLIEAYDLIKIDYLINEQISTKPLRRHIQIN